MREGGGNYLHRQVCRLIACALRLLLGRQQLCAQPLHDHLHTARSQCTNHSEKRAQVKWRVLALCEPYVTG